MRIRYAQRALNQLEGVYEYLAKRSKLVARRERDEILESLERLEENPQLGRPVNFLNTRKLVLLKGKYVALYTLRKREIALTSIVSARRNI